MKHFILIILLFIMFGCGNSDTVNKSNKIVYQNPNVITKICMFNKPGQIGGGWSGVIVTNDKKVFSWEMNSNWGKNRHDGIYIKKGELSDSDYLSLINAFHENKYESIKNQNPHPHGSSTTIEVVTPKSIKHTEYGYGETDKYEGFLKLKATLHSLNNIIINSEEETHPIKYWAEFLDKEKVDCFDYYMKNKDADFAP